MGEDEGEGQNRGMKKKFINFARKLRKRSTNTESYLWKYLRNKQIEGCKFRRQQVIGRYIVDFVSFEKKVVIEVDGGQHAIYKIRDLERDEELKRQGYKVLRFWDNDVLSNIEGVLEVIREQLLSPSSCPSPTRGEGNN